MGEPQVIGNRVLLGVQEKKIMKLYANLQEAEAALAKQVDMQFVLDIESTAEVREGCFADGICVIVDKYIEHHTDVTFGHMAQLAKLVDKLHKEKRVHGDLRLPNVLFGQGDIVHLIDFDGSCQVGRASFPPHPNVNSLGPQSRGSVLASKTIPAHFDWLCLPVPGRPAGAHWPPGRSAGDPVIHLGRRVHRPLDTSAGP